MREYVKQLIREIGTSRKISIVAHKNADPDAVSSAIALYYLLRRKCNDCSITIHFPEGVSSISNNLLEYLYECSATRLPIDYCDEILYDDTIVITVDMANPEQAGKCIQLLEESKSNHTLYVFDHHEQGRLMAMEETRLIGGSQYSSTAEIVSSILLELFPEPPSGDQFFRCILTLLISGIVYDTRRFQVIGENTFNTVSTLISKGGSYGTALSLIERPQDRSQKIAVLKALQRLIIREISELIVAGTHIGSYESQVARILVNIGADIAIVLSEKKDLYRVSLRSRGRKVNLSEFAQWVADNFGGSGGGHYESALYEGPLHNLEGNRDKKVKKLLELFASFYEKRYKNNE